jgi:hypothetical protein
MKVTKRTLTRLKAATTISAGGDLNDSTVSLCIYSSNIDLPRLTAQVGCAPTHGHRKGERPVPGGAPARVGLWALDAPDRLRFEKKIRYLLNVTTSDPGTWRRLAKTHDVQLRCAIFLHSWNEGFDLPAEVVAEMGRRLWKFSLAAYSAEGDEIVEAFLSDAVRKRERAIARPNQRLHATAPGRKVKRRE